MYNQESINLIVTKRLILIFIFTAIHLLSGCATELKIDQSDLDQLSEIEVPIDGRLLINIPQDEQTETLTIYNAGHRFEVLVGPELKKAISYLSPKIFKLTGDSSQENKGHLLFEITGNSFWSNCKPDGHTLHTGCATGNVTVKVIGKDGKQLGNFEGVGHEYSDFLKDKTMYYNAYLMAYEDVIEQILNSKNIQEIIKKGLGDAEDIVAAMEVEIARVKQEEARKAEELEKRKKPEIANAKANKIFNDLIKVDSSNIFNSSVKAYKKAYDDEYLATKLPGFNHDILVINDNSSAESPGLPIGQGPFSGSLVDKESIVKELKKYNQQNIILLQLMKPSISRDVLDEFKVKSTYISEYITKDNPEYAIAYYNYQNAVNVYNQAMLQDQFERAIKPAPTSAMTGFLSGVASMSKTLPAAHQVDKTKAILQNTPATIKVPIKQDYTYNVMQVKTTKKGGFYLYIIDLINNNVFSKFYPLTLSKKYTLPYGYNDNDEGPRKTFDKESDIDMFEKDPSGMVPSINDIVTNLEGTNIKDYETVKFNSKLEFIRKTEQPKDKKTEIVNKSTNKINKLFESVVAIQNNGGEIIGTGFFVQSNIILTNKHVVGERKIVSVKTNNKKIYVGKVTNTHFDLDLALIEIEGKGTPVQIYTGKELSEGLDVIAIGNPLGLEHTVSKGIISSIRQKKEDKPLATERLYIQTDVPINPGNSGGPLFMDGQVIGVNTIKLVGKDIEGIGFAIHYSEIDNYLKDKGIALTNKEQKTINASKQNSSASSIKDKLQALKSLYTEGLIDQDDYKSNKAKLLEQL